MFLFAKLVMQNLINQTSLACLCEEMSPNVFPRGLGQAYVDRNYRCSSQWIEVLADTRLFRYSRITRRILNDDRPAYKDAAHRLLAWMVCAVRPMKWKDVQAAAAIDVDSGTVDMRTRRLRVNYFDLCSPLVEARCDGTLTLVHSTAKA